ncbi:MAG: hypothetical protein LQ340_000655 [Diploschistes diacapsis]|nr:MAG: hypothetical protein LQ340_000655 [Diploschistes diacapsis]
MTTYISSLTLPSQFFAIPALAILTPVVAGSAVGFAVSPKNTQSTYLALKQPPLRPPPWIFGPVWTTLYGLMGYAAHRAWHTGSASLDPTVRNLAKHGATLYTLQLAMNLVWMPLFFGLKRPVEASVDIVCLTGVVSYLTYTWGQVDEVAGWCLVPYLGWLSFATYLSIGTGYLNNWDFHGKERSMPPRSNKDSVYVNEKKGN